MRHLIILGTVVGIGCAACAMARAEYGMQQPGYVYTGDQSETSPSDQSATAEDADATVTDQDTCGCGSCGCDPCCCGGGLLDCCLGDAWTLRDELTPCSDINYGGWFQIGYNSEQTRLSDSPGDLGAMNDYPDHLALHEAWFYVEKVAEPTCCDADWGFRFDILYGTDAQKTQAFGNENNVWDVSLDNGVYGWAMPQLYGEVAYGDWSVKAGHFFGIEGYEVVPATGNFFFSRSLTHFNSEPYTLTGVLAAYKGLDCLTVYGGWTLGWDTGFDQFGSGNSFLGGVSADVTEDVTVTYTSMAGNFGWHSGDRDGYSQSIVTDLALTNCLNYVVQTDYIQTNGVYYDPNFAGEEISIIQYLLYDINDCLAVGGRLEWWKSNEVTDDGFSASFQEVTGGINYRPHANVVIRPEIRYDWTNESVAANTELYNVTVFGIDAIVTF
jgi:hypothetical protein